MASTRHAAMKRAPKDPSGAAHFATRHPTSRCQTARRRLRKWRYRHQGIFGMCA